MSRALCALAGGAAGAGATWLYLRKIKPIMGMLTGGMLGTAGIDPAVHIRQIRRYAFAASQDKSPVVGLTHASYALILLDTLEESAGQQAVSATGVDPKKVRAFITKLQDMHAENLKACDSHLTSILALERGEGMQIPGFVVAGAGGAPRGA